MLHSPIVNRAVPTPLLFWQPIPASSKIPPHPNTIFVQPACEHKQLRSQPIQANKADLRAGILELQPIPRLYNITKSRPEWLEVLAGKQREIQRPTMGFRSLSTSLRPPSTQLKGREHRKLSRTGTLDFPLVSIRTAKPRFRMLRTFGESIFLRIPGNSSVIAVSEVHEVRYIDRA